jgi:hypothetical protein
MFRCLPIFLAAVASAVTIEQHHTHDFAFRAQVENNPFDVELTGEFRGPDGALLRIPGFHDGGGVWKIRFSPTRTGSWSLRTVSPVAALNGRTEAGIRCTPNTNPDIHGALRVDPAHPYHFVWEDGARYFLMGYECDWLWAIGMRDPDRGDMRRFVDQLASRGFNHVILNVYAHDTTWNTGRRNQWDYGPPELFPWEGTNEQPDHSRLNPEFFRAYDRVIEYLRDKGIVAHLMIKVYNKLVNWPPPGSRGEERWFRYIAARYQACSNVVWDFSKEAYYEKDNALQKKLIDLVRATDAYHRPTTVHDHDAYDWDPVLNANLDFRSDQQHSQWAEMVAFDRAVRKRPVVNVEFGYERGVEDLPTYRVMQDWPEVLRRAWLIYLAGGYGVYYYSNTAWDLIKPEPEPPGYARFQLLKETLSALPYWRMEPANRLAVEGPCLAQEGEAYACYAEGKRITVNLTGMAPSSTAEWIDTWTGVKRSAVIDRPGVHAIEKPKDFGEAPGLLVVRRAQGAR